VHIGTRVARVGRSSVTLAQGVFQNESLVALAETGIVQMDDETRRSRPLKPETAERLGRLTGF